MKKIIALLLALTLALCLCACGGSKTPASSTDVPKGSTPAKTDTPAKSDTPAKTDTPAKSGGELSGGFNALFYTLGNEVVNNKNADFSSFYAKNEKAAASTIKTFYKSLNKAESAL